MKEQTGGLSQALSLLSAVRGMVCVLVALLVLELLSAGPAIRAKAAGSVTEIGRLESRKAETTAFINRPKAGRMLIPVGRTVGIKLFADGVMVVGISEIAGPKGACSPAKACGLQEGDIITYVNSDQISSTENLKAALQKSGEEPLTIRVLRNGRLIQMNAKTVQSTDDGAYKLGAWTRDSMAGIGTLTFYDPESGVFGALGHGINDVDTSLLVPLKSGSIMQSSVTKVIRGQIGSPGELRGQFDLTTDLGVLFANTDSGVFGTMTNKSFIENKTALPAAGRGAAKVGKATILSNVAGDTVEEYEVEITKVYSGATGNPRNMMLKVTDKRLLEQTGGIVQGMSGSPILQDGKLIGAVTHVLVGNPTEGYGVFIENMLEQAFWQENENVS